MTIYNLGSVNVDHFYRLPHLPAAGETLSAVSHETGLGGKGANQSVAAARAGSTVRHIGAIGRADGWARERLEGYGVDCRDLSLLDGASGHALIYVDADGENMIVLEPGANTRQDRVVIEGALGAAMPGDTLLLQNETDMQGEAARIARAAGLRVIYSAAPFSVEAVRAVLPDVTLLVMNAVEAAQLTEALGMTLDELAVPEVLVTLGAKGARWRSNETGEVIEVAAPRVVPVDTTAAGDTFIGYFAAGLDQGRTVAEALDTAARAAALKVTRAGTADAIPSADEVAKAAFPPRTGV